MLVQLYSFYQQGFISSTKLVMEMEIQNEPHPKPAALKMHSGPSSGLKFWDL